MVPFQSSIETHSTRLKEVPLPVLMVRPLLPHPTLANILPSTAGDIDSCEKRSAYYSPGGAGRRYVWNSTRLTITFRSPKTEVKAALCMHEGICLHSLYTAYDPMWVGQRNRIVGHARPINCPFFSRRG